MAGKWLCLQLIRSYGETAAKYVNRTHTYAHAHLNFKTQAFNLRAVKIMEVVAGQDGKIIISD